MSSPYAFPQGTKFFYTDDDAHTVPFPEELAALPTTNVPGSPWTEFPCTEEFSGFGDQTAETGQHRCYQNTFVDELPTGFVTAGPMRLRTPLKDGDTIHREFLTFRDDKVVIRFLVICPLMGEQTVSHMFAGLYRVSVVKPMFDDFSKLIGTEIEMRQTDREIEFQEGDAP